MPLNDNWFTEESTESGSAFSLKIKTILHEETTDFQHIEIYETENFGRLMVIDGFIMLTGRDNFIYHEMMSHPVLFTHPNPQRVVVIGGGDCGTIREVLKHSNVKEAWQIEIDERVTRLSEQYFPELCSANNDPRAKFFFGDGIKWIEEVEPNSLDVIIVDSTDPIGPAEGLFSTPFYHSCIKALAVDGILVQQSESPLIHLNILTTMHKAMKKAGFCNTQTLHYPQCVYPSGWWSATMASCSSKLETIRDEAATLPFETSYYNKGIHIGALNLPNYLHNKLKDMS